MDHQERRSKLLIEPHFQIRMIVRLAAWVAFATVITGIVTWGVLNYEDRTQPGSYFYVQPEGGAAPVILKRSGLILPAVALSLIVNLSLCVLFALHYSRQLAGPVFRMRETLRRLSHGEHVHTPFLLRKSDEFHELAAALDFFLERTRRKG